MFVTAYIDPSSMTYLIQIIAGVGIAAAAGIGFYWKRIKRSLRAKQEEKAADAAQQTPVQDLGEGETITADMLLDDASEKSDKQA